MITQIDIDEKPPRLLPVTVSCGTELAGEGDKLPVHVEMITSFQFHNGRLECMRCVVL
jgi:hypothetical protein